MTPEQEQRFKFRLRLEREQAAEQAAKKQLADAQIARGGLQRAPMGGSPLAAAKGLLGLGEVGLEMGSNLGASALAGATGAVADAVTGPVLDVFGVPHPSGADIIEKMRADIPTYHPKSETGKFMSEKLGALMGRHEKVQEFLGDKTLAATGSPALAGLAYSALPIAETLVGAPKGVKAPAPRTNNVVNIGLKVGKDGTLTPAEAQAALESQGVKVIRHEVRESATEPTFIAEISRPLTEAEGSSLAAMTKQDAIAHRAGESGALYGPRAKEWGPFDPAQFLEPKPLNVFPEKGGTLREIKDALVGDTERLVRRHHQGRIGAPADINVAATRLEKVKELVPGDRPTAAEALVGVPQGTSLIADQKLVARQAGGPSIRFGERKMEQNTVRETARRQVEKDLGPVRERILDEANRKGAADANLETPVAPGQPSHTGIKFGGVKSELQTLKSLKGRSEIADQVLDKVADRLSEKVQPNGLIDARDLYALRKDLTKTIQDFAETGVGKNKKGWGKGQTRRLASEIEKVIDNAIENADQAPAGKGWTAEYMKPYAARMQQVEASEIRAKNALKPVQATEAEGVKAVKGAPPHVFSRALSYTNYLLGLVGKSREPAMIQRMGEQFRDPALLAKAIRGEPPPLPGPRARFSTRGAIPGYMTESEKRRQLAAAALRQ